MLSVNFSLKLALWFLRRRFLNDPTPFLHFCDYLPFEKDLALDLYNFEFPLPKDDLYQVLLKLAWRVGFVVVSVQLFHRIVVALTDLTNDVTTLKQNH